MFGCCRYSPCCCCWSKASIICCVDLKIVWNHKVIISHLYRLSSRSIDRQTLGWPNENVWKLIPRVILELGQLQLEKNLIVLLILLLLFVYYCCCWCCCEWLLAEGVWNSKKWKQFEKHFILIGDLLKIEWQRLHYWTQSGRNMKG